MIAIPLSGKKGFGRAVLIDNEDLPAVAGHRWYLHEYPGQKPGRRNKGPYAITAVRRDNGQPVSQLMHVMITDWPMTDHIDHDGLNNQRSNLRPATSSQNQANRRRGVRGSSKYKGVCRARRKWRAQIKVNGVKRHLGCFATEEEAALAYNAAALEAFGSYAYLNQVSATTEAA